MLDRWRTRIRRFFLRRWLPQEITGGLLMEGSNPRVIDDGVDYSRPVPMPRQVRDMWPLWDQKQRTAYLCEAMPRDSFRFQFDTPQRSTTDLPIAPTTEDPLEEWDYSTRQQVLSNCHAAYDRNPIAKAAVDYTVSFVVGDGMNITYRNAEVRKVLEAFIESEDNPVRELEKTLLADLQLDGEIILRFFEESGETVIVPMRPWELQEIETEEGFYRRAENYKFILDGKTKEIPADEILFVAINRRSYHQRGKPDLYVILPWLRAYKEWLEDRARQNFWRGALLFFLKVASSSATAIASVAGRWKKPPAPGSVAVESDKVSLESIQSNVGAADAGDDGRQFKLMNAVGMRLPEYFLADGENANLASSTNQELPALTKFQDYQQIMLARVWRPVFRRVIQNAIEAGMIHTQNVDGEIHVPAHTKKGDPTGETVPLRDAFEVAYEPFKQSDPLNVAQAMVLALNQELASKETASTEMGFDYEDEQERMRREREEVAKEMAQGIRARPPTMRPEAMGSNGQEQEGEEEHGETKEQG